MQLKRCLWMIVICFMLISCAGTRTRSTELNAGKSSFESGNYKLAFRRLLPIAVNGNAEAQYAVGYMYFYGYGVSMDGETGIFWMTRSAEQHYPPAVKALKILHHPTPEYESAIPVRQQPIIPLRRRTIQVKKITYIETPDKVTTIIKTKSTIKTKTTRKYALQLYGSYHLNSVEALQMQLRLKNTGHIYQTKNQGKDWYVLTFGNFASAHEASATQHNLPSELKQLHPWVRDVDALQVV